MADNKKRSLKRQLRDTRRLLTRESLPETVRQTKERIADMLEDEIKEKQRVNRERKTNRRYKMVKFFERRKLMRRIKSLSNDLKTVESDEEKESIRSLLQAARQDFNYITHYPDGLKYISLYPTSETSQESLSKREAIHKDINSKVDGGELWDSTIPLLEPSSSSMSMKNQPELRHVKSSEDKTKLKWPLQAKRIKLNTTERTNQNEDDESSAGEETEFLTLKKKHTKRPACDIEDGHIPDITHDPFFMRN